MSTLVKDSHARPTPASLHASTAAFKMTRQHLLDCIVAYFNDTDVNISETADRAITAVRDLGFLDYTRFTGLSRLAVVLMLEGGLSVGTEKARSRKQEISVESITGELRKHRPEFCAAVSWLCAEKPEPESASVFKQWAASDFRGEAPGTFRDALESGKIGRYPDIDRTSENFIAYFEQHGLRHMKLRAWMPDWQRIFLYASCAHWVDYFCSFLLNECMHRLPNQMPIKLCRRCRKLFSPTRPDMEFCPGSDCQRKNFWTEDRHRDYEYMRRLMKFAGESSLEDRRAKLAKPKVKKRMQDIRQRWQGWPKILEMIGKTEKLASGSGRSKV